MQPNHESVVAYLPAAFDPVLHTKTKIRSLHSDGKACDINNNDQPARMAFPGCVIFLPPTAAAARFLLVVYDSW